MIKKVFAFCSMLICFGICFHIIKKEVKAFSITDEETISEVDNTYQEKGNLDSEFIEIDTDISTKNDEQTEEDEFDEAAECNSWKHIFDKLYKRRLNEETLIIGFTTFIEDEELLDKYLSLPYEYQYEIYFRLFNASNNNDFTEINYYLSLSVEEIVDQLPLIS